MWKEIKCRLAGINFLWLMILFLPCTNIFLERLSQLHESFCSDKFFSTFPVVDNRIFYFCYKGLFLILDSLVEKVLVLGTFRISLRLSGSFRRSTFVFWPQRTTTCESFGEKYVPYNRSQQLSIFMRGVWPKKASYIDGFNLVLRSNYFFTHVRRNNMALEYSKISRSVIVFHYK